MSEFILLDQPQTLNGTLNLAITPRCYDDVQRCGQEPISFLRKITGLPMLIFLQRGTNRVTYSLYTHWGSFSVTFTDNGVVLLTAFRQNRLRDNTDCLKYGISVRGNSGVSISIKLNDAHQVFQTFQNGKEVLEETHSPQTAQELSSLLANRRGSTTPQRPLHFGPGEYQIPPRMEEYLALAEAYTHTEDDLERARAQQSPPLLYRDLKAARGFDRQDRMAYNIRVDDFEDSEYGINKKVQIEQSDGTSLAATVIAADRSSEGNTLTLLFEDQVSFSVLPKMGTLRPTYSDIQCEVRQSVIDGLRKGTSEATFLEQVLGYHQTTEFGNQDLRILDAELKKQKYPPNSSQVEAIHRGINAKDILLVMGPPGTGKTTVILEWVKYFIKTEHKRVLISSQNNKAVDNVLERLTEERDISAIRAGNEAKVQANMYPYLLENRIKQLQSDMESRNTTNLLRISKLLEASTAYGHTADEVYNGRQTLNTQKHSLLDYADNRYSHIKRQFLENQQQRNSQQDELGQLLSEFRRWTFWMMDPQKHPILRLFLTPFRGIFRRRAARALERYEQLYQAYCKNKQIGQNLFTQLDELLNDSELLSRANQLSQFEEHLDCLQASLEHSPLADDIFPDWKQPSLVTNMDDAQLQVFIQQVRQYRDRIQALQETLVEWNQHIRAQSNYALSDLLLESVDLVGGTCIGINSQRKFTRVDFDVTIIDEAGQIQIHNALVPMSRSPKVIMLGDHKQIPPIADQEQVALCQERDIDASLLETSLFERLYEQLPEQNKIMLDTQYRMPAQLGDLLSEWFYDGKYYSFEGKKNMPSICSNLFHSPFVIVDTSGEANRREYKPEMGAGNQLEADLVALMVSCMLDSQGSHPLTSDAFGVISPYGEQVENMRKAIKKQIPALRKEEIHEMVASLDSFQGQERKVILYSCTRSNTRSPERSRIGFLKELRRLNVALSRPKEQLVFIGDMDFLASCRNGSGIGSETEFSAFIRLMMEHARRNGEIITVAELRHRAEVHYGRK